MYRSKRKNSVSCGEMVGILQIGLRLERNGGRLEHCGVESWIEIIFCLEDGMMYRTEDR